MPDELLKLYQGANAEAYEERRRKNAKWKFEHDCLRHVLDARHLRIHSIIDAPVGTGRFLDLYHELSSDMKIYGLDYSDDMLEMARRKSKHGNVDLQKHDIINSPLTVSADLVVCFRFLNLIPWENAIRALHHLFSATKKILVVAIRTVADDYVGETFLENKIYLHKRSAFDRIRMEYGFDIMQVNKLDTERAGDYCIITLTRRKAIRNSRVTKSFRLVYTYGSTETEGKIYEVKDPAHARFVEVVTTQSTTRNLFPRINDVYGNFIDVEWVQGGLLPVGAWSRCLDALVQIQSLPDASESSFDYVQDLVVPRFHKALPLIGHELYEQVVSAIHDSSASFAAKVSHPDIIPGNVVVSGDELIIIDNELLCRSRHHRIDVLNLLHNLKAPGRARILARYLRLIGETLAGWEAHSYYLNNLWFARQIGAAIIRNQTDLARACVRAFKNEENVLPYDPSELRKLPCWRDDGTSRSLS